MAIVRGESPDLWKEGRHIELEIGPCLRCDSRAQLQRRAPPVAPVLRFAKDFEDSFDEVHNRLVVPTVDILLPREPRLVHTTQL